MPNQRSELSRRGFLTTAATGLVSAGLAGLPGRAFSEEVAQAAAPKDIIYRTLGRTGLKVPIVSMGVMNADHPEIVQAAYEAGVRHFDTAAAYQFGRNEQMLGSVIKKMGIRNDIIIGTKIAATELRAETPPKDAKKRFIRAMDASLKRLKTDNVEILYVHSVAEAETVANPLLMEAVKEVKDSGKAQFVAISTHTAMSDVINAVTEGGFYDIVLTSWNFTLADDTDLVKAIANAAAKGVGIIAMKTQAGGARLPNPATRKNFTSSVMATAAIRWAMRNENIATSIPGFDNFEHMAEDFAIASNLEFHEEEEKFLSDNSIKLGYEFCRQCSECLGSCPSNADIPTLMRTHMYAKQYGNFDHARLTLTDISHERNLTSACGSCVECVAQCVRSVNIPRKIEELKTIYA